MSKKIWLPWAVVFMLTCSFCSGVYGQEGWEAACLASAEGAGHRPVIVIDPGHGGMDGGASAADGTLEKDLNLAVALALAEEAAAYPVEVVMTRTEDRGLYDNDDDLTIRAKKREDLLRRREIIEEAQPAVAVSIHMNSFLQDESVCGAQVFYPKDHEGRTDVRTGTPGSEQFAVSVGKSLETNVPGLRPRQVMTKDDILLFENAEAPVILVECGFLSNAEEVRRLKTAEYQRLLARAVWAGINEILCLEKTEKLAIIDSANNWG